MSKTGKAVVWIIVIALIVWGLVAVSKKQSAPADTTGPIKVGFVGPLTGELANMGENAQAAVQIAVDEVNKAGGVNGRQIEVVYEDDMCTGATGANAISKLINTDKVSAVLGSVCSGATLGEAPIAEAAKIPQLSYCATNPTISQAGDYIFRDVPSDLFQAKYAANYFVGHGMKKVSLLTIKNDWGDGLNKAFTDAFTAAGGTIVTTDAYSPDTKDLRTELTKIKSANPDAVYFAGFTDSTIAGLKQAHDLGMKQQFFGADAWDDSKIWTELGSLGNGAMYTIVGTNSSDAFKAAMKAKLNKDDIVYCSNYAYDGLKILTAAMTRAKSSEPTAIKTQLYNTNYSGGVSAKQIMFDANGDPTDAAYVIKQVKNGKAVEIPQ